MFVRFRLRNDRLLASLAESRRAGGKVRQRHIANLGAIDRAPSVGARLAFWRELHLRLGRLSNRIAADELGAILGAVQARIPMVTIEEQTLERQARLERDLRWWQQHLEMSEEQVDLHQNLKATVEERIGSWTGAAERARANIAATEAALEDPDKPSPPELTRKEVLRIWRDSGWTKQDAYPGAQAGGTEQGGIRSGAQAAAGTAAKARVVQKNSRKADSLTSDGRRRRLWGACCYLRVTSLSRRPQDHRRRHL
jgi:hypothetical protein